MSLRMLESGITAIQAGSKIEGARLLRIALKSGELSHEMNCIAYLWLATSTDDPLKKRQYANDAVAADPHNEAAQRQLAALLTSELPASTSTQPQAVVNAPSSPAARPTIAEQIVGVVGGPNGPGTAFFVSADGLLATTRFVAGGMERVTLDLPASARQIGGQVVRSWPDLDLALIRAEVSPAETLPISPLPAVPDDTALVGIAADGQQLRARQRPTKRVMAPYWIPTDMLKLSDAGGSPLFDPRNYLVGMLTRNTSRSSGYVFGVHISAIRRAVDQYLQEITSGERRTYCPGCGYNSRATANGYFHCEICGALSTEAQSLHRFPQGDPYTEPNRIRCTHCNAQVGFHGGRCLRCGQSAGTPLTV